MRDIKAETAPEEKLECDKRAAYFAAEQWSLQEIAMNNLHQVVDRKHQFAAGLGGSFVTAQINRRCHDLFITMGQRQAFIRLAGCAQKPPHFLHKPESFINPFQCGFHFHVAALDALEQTTFKRPAAHGPAAVNLAELSVETGAGLGKDSLRALLFERQAESNQAPRVIVLLQLHVGKQNAVAAQAAVRTKLFNTVHRQKCFGYFRASSDLIFG
jgi:hypothetical protein